MNKPTENKNKIIYSENVRSFLFFYHTLTTVLKIRLRAENTADMLSLKAVHPSQERQSVILTMIAKHVSWLYGVSSPNLYIGEKLNKNV